jgi:hypothetical protein
MRMAGPARFAIRVRVPDWAMPMKLRGARVREGWAELPALWDVDRPADLLRLVTLADFAAWRS